MRFYALYQLVPDSSLVKDFHGVEFEATDQKQADSIAKAFSHDGHRLYGSVSEMQLSPVTTGYEIKPK